MRKHDRQASVGGAYDARAKHSDESNGAPVSANSLRREWVGFTTMSVGLFMAILDIQIVASALPRIAQSLNTPLDELSWVQTAYLITEVIGIAMSGRLARAMSTRWLFACATFAFAATSFGCALSHEFATLIVWRTLQGFAAGTITPTVFAAGYKMFPKRLQHRAIVIAGVCATLAPTVGPFIGGFIAQKFTWNWLFFINVPIGLVITAIVVAVVRVDVAEPRSWKTIDVVGFLALSAALTCLQTMLKLGPEDHWHAPRDYGLIAGTLVAGYLAIRRCVNAHDPLVDLRPLRTVGFVVASAYNFVAGLALYSSLYVLPLFLGFVRYHTPLEIGTTMTVMGAAQLLSAPVVGLVDRRLPTAWLVFAGFTLFGAGAFANAFQTPQTDFAQLLWPQILRGVGLLFCIVPITNVALEHVPAGSLSNASGLLNFMRNVGGAIGIGLVDTIINVRPIAIKNDLLAQLVAGNAKTAGFVGIPVGLMKGADLAHVDPGDAAFLKGFMERAAATVAFNEAWLLIGAIVFASLLLLPFVRRPSTDAPHALELSPERFASELPVAP